MATTRQPRTPARCCTRWNRSAGPGIGGRLPSGRRPLRPARKEPPSLMEAAPGRLGSAAGLPSLSIGKSPPSRRIPRRGRTAAAFFFSIRQARWEPHRSKNPFLEVEPLRFAWCRSSSGGHALQPGPGSKNGCASEHQSDPVKVSAEQMQNLHQGGGEG